MTRSGQAWWNGLQVQQKVWAILLVVFVPLMAALAVHVTLIKHIVAVQQQHHQVLLAREQVHLLRRLAVDIEDAFRGYLLTRQKEFLRPMDEAAPKLRPAVDRLITLVQSLPNTTIDAEGAGRRLTALLESKHALLQKVRAGRLGEVLRYVRSGQGIFLSDALRDDFRIIEDRLDQQLKGFELDEAGLVRLAFWGLSLAVCGGLVLGLIGARLLARSITGPLATLRESVTMLGTQIDGDRTIDSIDIRSSDEIGHLARSYEDMARRIRQQIRELEAISAIGHAINTIGPDGLDGVLRRITDHAADLLKVDVCLVMLRNEAMGCWVVEAASGEWNERLHKAVMLWEEFPVSVQAFETKQPAVGENLRLDGRAEVVRRNVFGESMLSIPLLSQGTPFGVLVLLLERRISREAWNVRLAKGFADEAAVAIANANLYEAVQQRGQGLESRLRHLEQVAETLAHDLKAPGERVKGLASMLRTEYGWRVDARGARWIALIEENGAELIERAERILEMARVGFRPETIEAVDPAMAIHDVLKLRAGELERHRVRVHVQKEIPMVACHPAYMRQIFENLLSNAIKFSVDRPAPEIHVAAEPVMNQLRFVVSDNGLGIPSGDRERVFLPFVRLNQNSAKGSGIGLAIVRRIVELYGGRVWIDSNEWGGCSVMFTLPMLGDLRRDVHPRPVDSVERPRESDAVPEKPLGVDVAGGRDKPV